jgi:putative adhesin
MKLLTIATAALALAALPALASEATFERTLSVSGHVELTVNTGSGNIHLTKGTSNVVHVVGHVRSDWGNYEDRVREIAANPPIEQTGNIIRIGAHHENLNHVSISYEIQAPEDSFLDAGSGSGNIEDDGVGENAKISTGSGNIHAVGLRGNFSVGTGSGDVYAEQTGEGDVKAQTGSGTIELKDIHGGLRAGTGSGDIKVNGSPATDWKLETGSGSVELWPGSAGFTLDASTGSGSIHTDGEMTVQGSFDKHHITGKIRGGGPTVRAGTGSGDIKIH